MTPYDKLISRKRTWTPVQTEAGKLKTGAEEAVYRALALRCLELPVGDFISHSLRSEEHTSELQSHSDLVCRLLLEKKKAQPHK